MALGGDQGCSIRAPAHYCGIVGLKPTHGLVPYTGVMPVELTIDHIGPMARSVYDTALLLEVSGFLLYITLESICTIFHTWYWVSGNFTYGMPSLSNSGI